LISLLEQVTKVSKEHQSVAALEAEAKRSASRFVREERHINSLQRKLQQLVEQQKVAMNAIKVCNHVRYKLKRLSFQLTVQCFHCNLCRVVQVFIVRVP
jgi:ferredoxin-like protein FixX